MDTIELLNSDITDLPKSNLYRESFEDYLSKIIDEYVKEVKKLTVTDILSLEIVKLLPDILIVCESVKEALKAYYGGFPNVAYNIIESTLKKYDTYIENLITPGNIAKEIQYLYRMRLSDGKQLGREELFHIPFELRRKVVSYRYSIPGLPCLYFGGSSYVCWEEMQRPEYSKIHIARFRPRVGTNLRVLDFGYRPALSAAWINANPKMFQSNGKPVEFIKSYILLWALIASCSIQTKDRSAHFKPEYVIPQLVFQWLTANTKADGIRYFSTNVSQYGNMVHPVANFVFPSKTFAANGYCRDLQDKFELSQPIHWDIITRVNINAAVTTPNDHFQLQFIPGIMTTYHDTEFCLVENKIATFPTAPI